MATILISMENDDDSKCTKHVVYSKIWNIQISNIQKIYHCTLHH